MKSRPSTPAPAVRPSGEILGNAVYTLSEFTARTGMTASAMREARRAGLPVHQVGKRRFVVGQQSLDFLNSSKERCEVVRET
jgi:hypothetical protein